MKNIKSIELIPGENQPFKDCKLDREKYADVLTEIVSTYSDGFVLAIDNEWGTGKTTFVRMWQKKLELQEFQTAYFNAWENDFDSNPMVAIMSELKTLIKDESKFDKIVKIGSKITKNVLPTVAKTVASLFASTKEISEIIEKIVEASADVLSEEISEHQKKKESLVEFRTVLAESIQVEGIIKPIVFFIDELDRCRPDYAVETLEKVKHFFNVPGIVFVLSIDKKQLSHSINGYYGSENFNSNEYLRRFIDVEYSIPEPSVGSFISYLYGRYELKEFFTNSIQANSNEIVRDGATIQTFSQKLFIHNNINLRQIEKIFAHCSIVLKIIGTRNFIFPDVLILLIFLKYLKNNVYLKIKNKQFNFQELIDSVELLLPSDERNYENLENLETIASILVFYAKYYSEYNYEEEIFKFSDFKTKTRERLKVKSIIDTSENNIDFFSTVNRLLSGRNRPVSLKYLIDKIDLTEKFSTLQKS